MTEDAGLELKTQFIYSSVYTAICCILFLGYFDDRNAEEHINGIRPEHNNRIIHLWTYSESVMVWFYYEKLLKDEILPVSRKLDRSMYSYKYCSHWTQLASYSDMNSQWACCSAPAAQMTNRWWHGGSFDWQSPAKSCMGLRVRNDTCKPPGCRDTASTWSCSHRQNVSRPWTESEWATLNMEMFPSRETRLHSQIWLFEKHPSFKRFVFLTG